MHQFDPVTKTYVNSSDYNNSFAWTTYLTCEIDPVARKMIAIGNGKMFQWDISDPSNVLTEQVTNTTGDNSIESGSAPGFAYDTTNKKMVAWDGGADVYVFDVSGNSWTRLAPSASNTVTPTDAAHWGTYGRFRWSPNREVFVVVNNKSENVFIYKPDYGSSSVRSGISVANRLELSAFPNPFVRTTRISVSGDITRLDIYSLDGKRVFSDSKKQERIVWNAAGLSPGVYFAKARSGNRVLSRRLVLMAATR